MASPTPSVVPDSPTLATVEVPSPASPKARATSPRAVVAPNWAKPAATVAAATARIAGWRQPCSRTLPAAEEEESAPGSPGGDDPGAPVEDTSLVAPMVGCRQGTLAPDRTGPRWHRRAHGACGQPHASFSPLGYPPGWGPTTWGRGCGAPGEGAASPGEVRQARGRVRQARG